MAKTANLETGNRFDDYVAYLSPSALEQFKLERLVELRAVIEGLRGSPVSRPPNVLPLRDPRKRQ